MVQLRKVGSRRGHELNLAKLTRAQLGECFLADLQARTRRAGQSLELDEIGEVGKNFGRLRGSSRIDQRQARMRRADGIGEDALPRMEGVGALARESLRGFAARAAFGFGTLHFHQREISDGARPGEFGVLERGVMGRRGGEPRERHDDENEVPQGGGSQSTAWNALLDPAIAEKSPTQKSLGDI